MSVIPRDIIAAIAEAVNAGPLEDEVAAALVPDVEYRVREIVQEAAKFMRHAKRRQLTAADVNSALRLRNVEPLYGFGPGAPPVRFLAAGEAGDLFYMEDEELSLNDVIEAPLPRCPVDVTFGAHWLAVEGVQPAIPQNPPAALVKARADLVPGDEDAAPAAGATGAANAAAPGGAAAAAPKADGAGGQGGDAASEVRPIVKHVLSKELQMYYQKITDAVLGDDERVRQAALRSVAEDPGLHQLVPYFVQFVSSTIAANLRNVAVLHAVMRTVRAMLENETLFLEPYLHQLMPAILTGIVGRRLAKSPQDDHWSLRDFSAQVLHTVCAKYVSGYGDLQARASKTLLRAFLDLNKPLTTHYGAVKGLAALGLEVVRVLLLPNVKAYGAVLSRALNAAEGDEERRIEAEHVKGALVEAVGNLLRHDRDEADRMGAAAPSSLGDYSELYGLFGEPLFQYVSSAPPQ